MPNNRLSDKVFLERLKANPGLRARMESLLLAVDDEKGDLREADAAEMRIIDEMRQMGREALTVWAEGQVTQRTEELTQARGIWREGKKNCDGIAPLEK